MNKVNPIFSAMTDIDNSIITDAKKPRKSPKALIITAAVAAAVGIVVFAWNYSPTPHGSGIATADVKTKSDYINEDIIVRSGYYTCDEDKSYIHVDGNKIELCNFDYEADAEEAWNNAIATLDETERSKQASNHDSYIEESIKDAKEQHRLQDFTPYTFVFGEKESTMLVINFEFAHEHGTYTGYTYNEDGSIKKGNIYHYSGTKKPQ